MIHLRKVNSESTVKTVPGHLADYLKESAYAYCRGVKGMPVFSLPLALRGMPAFVGSFALDKADFCFFLV